MDYQAEALKKIQEERKGVSGQKELAMASSVADVLCDFCRQDGEFAQAVAQGGSFPECMAAVAKGVGGFISDLEAYRKAVQFYFPGADIQFQMKIDLCPQAGTPEELPTPAGGGIILDFKSLFF